MADPSHPSHRLFEVAVHQDQNLQPHEVSFLLQFGSLTSLILMFIANAMSDLYQHLEVALFNDAILYLYITVIKRLGCRI